jgi:hypothetical protein
VAKGFGFYKIKQGRPDRRHGVLPWTTLFRREAHDPMLPIGSADTKCQAQKLAQKHARHPEGRRPKAGSLACTRIVPQGDVDVIERNPACTPRGVDIDSPAKLHAAMRELVAKQGREVFWCIGKSTQGEMVGQPVQVAVGTVNTVHVEVADFVGHAARLRQAGALSAAAVHCHPSGRGDNPSPEDKNLTKRLKAGMEAIAMPFDGHFVFTEKNWSRA